MFCFFAQFLAFLLEFDDLSDFLEDASDKAYRFNYARFNRESKLCSHIEGGDSKSYTKLQEMGEELLSSFTVLGSRSCGDVAWMPAECPEGYCWWRDRVSGNWLNGNLLGTIWRGCHRNGHAFVSNPGSQFAVTSPSSMIESVSYSYVAF